MPKVNFRFSDSLNESLKTLASRMNMSASEVVRTLIEREAGIVRTEEPVRTPNTRPVRTAAIHPVVDALAGITEDTKPPVPLERPFTTAWDRNHALNPGNGSK